MARFSSMWAALGASILAVVLCSPPLATASGRSGHIHDVGVDLYTSIDEIHWHPAGDRVPRGMLFSHDVHVNGRYSIIARGDRLESGSAAAGFILGCGVSAAGGVSLGLGPSQGVGGALAITLSVPPGFSISPALSANVNLGENITATVEPGQVTAVVTANASFSGNSKFPYHLAFSEGALDLSQCFTAVWAVPFVTASVSTDHTTIQTTAYGDQFAF